ncbi:MAG: hypothetical protein ACYDA2_10380 [Acidimicrobiales bacterium]
MLSSEETFSSTDEHLAKSINDLKTALASSSWPGGGNGNTLLASGGSVFDQVKNGIQDILGVPNAPASWNVAGLVSKLDSATRLLASTAISMNSCSAKNPNALASAKQELSNGDAELSAGHANNAVDHYKNAWQQALQASGTTC